jgi:Spy/CpxP family protein refolding chaperone
MRNRASLWILAALACLPVAACGSCGDKGGGTGSSGTVSSSTAALSASASSSAVASASASSSAIRRNAMMVRAGGAVGALFRAASQADLTDEQKTKIEAIATDLREGDKTEAADGGGPAKEMKALQEVLVAGVKAGRIDQAKLEPHYAALEKEAKERAARDVDGLGKLHDVLDAEQRKKLAEQVKKQEEDRNEKAKKAEAMHADAGPRPTPQKRRFERYGKELDLDADQKKKLDAMIPNEDPKLAATIREEGKKRVDVTCDAFMKDTWDGKGIPGPDIKQIRKPMDERVKFLNSLMGILKPEQKEKLVTRIEKEGGPGGGEHRRPPGMRPGSGGDREHNDDDKDDDKEH